MLRLIPTCYAAKGFTEFRPCVRTTRNGKMVGSKAANVVYADMHSAVHHALLAAFDVVHDMRGVAELSAPVYLTMPEVQS